MGSASALEEIFGTDEPVGEAIQVCVGDLSCRAVSGALRLVKWQNTEIIRGLEVSIRDENWGTFAQDDVKERWVEDGGLTKFTRSFTVANRALSGVLTIVFDPAGQIDAELSLTAQRKFSTNRAGFTLLHPLAGIAGTPVEIMHSDGKSQHSKFPQLISPHQPFLDISKIEHRVGAIDVRINFAGEVFEMEDHRNWSDASFKTYCRPLSKPFPYVIEAGQTVQQHIAISVGGKSAVAQTQAPFCSQPIQIDRSGKPGAAMPDILLAAEQDWSPDAPNEAEAGGKNTNGLLIRLDENVLKSTAWIDSLAPMMTNSQAFCDVEIIVPQGASPAPYLNKIAALLKKRAILPCHVLALPQPYLKTIRESRGGPTGISPQDCILAAQTAFPESIIGAGMLTNFTEFNRSRPAPEMGSYVSFSTSAIVHAADDTSVFETLEALPHIFATVKSLNAGRPLRLGLMSIGMRSNPYGDGVAQNPQNIRMPMAQNDPRQAGLFGAAFGVGIAACVCDAGCLAFAPAATSGPFSIAQGKKLFPLFHVVKALGDLAGNHALPIKNLPPHIYGLAAPSEDGTVHAVLGNCSTTPKQITFSEQVQAVCLDDMSFLAAAGDPDWLFNTTKSKSNTFLLRPCAVIFVDMGSGK